MTEEAVNYLNDALNHIQAHSVRREYIDWPALRQDVTDMAAAAQTPAETYPAIRRALEMLGDHHSIFFDPTTVQLRKQARLQRIGFQAVYPQGTIGVVYPGSPAEQAGLQVGDRLETMNGLPIATLTLEEFRDLLKEPELTLTLIPARGGDICSVHMQASVFELRRQPQGRRLPHNLGYLELPELVAQEAGTAYAATAHHLIRTIDHPPTQGWVVDLRGNYGGGSWPMLAGIGPILGEGKCVGFVAPHERLDGTYRQGRAWIEQMEEVSVAVDEPYTLSKPWPPVAVLTSQITASAAEFIVLAFRGRPRTRSFGEPTHGVPTGNDVHEMSDGAWLGLTTHLGADRTGQTYDDPLPPDEFVPIEWTKLGTDDDPVLKKAIQWLCTETGALE